MWRYRNGNQRNAAERALDEPAPTVHFGHASNAVDWVHERPAPTIVTTRRSKEGLLVGRQLPEGEGENVGGRNWPSHMAKKEDRPERKAQGAGNRPRPVEAPAATLDTRTDLAEWVDARPATTVAGDPRVHPPGHKINSDDEAAGREYDGRAGKNAVRVTVEEAAILQSFRPDYPWQGSRTKQFEQVGNAVPPLLAFHVLRALTEADDELEAAA